MGGSLPSKYFASVCTEVGMELDKDFSELSTSSIDRPDRSQAIELTSRTPCPGPNFGLRQHRETWTPLS